MFRECFGGGAATGSVRVSPLTLDGGGGGSGALYSADLIISPQKGALEYRSPSRLSTPQLAAFAERLRLASARKASPAAAKAPPTAARPGDAPASPGSSRGFPELSARDESSSRGASSVGRGAENSDAQPLMQPSAPAGATAGGVASVVAGGDSNRRHSAFPAPSDDSLFSPRGAAASPGRRAASAEGAGAAADAAGLPWYHPRALVPPAGAALADLKSPRGGRSGRSGRGASPEAGYCAEVAPIRARRGQLQRERETYFASLQTARTARAARAAETARAREASAAAAQAEARARREATEALLAERRARRASAERERREAAANAERRRAERAERVKRAAEERARKAAEELRAAEAAKAAAEAEKRRRAAEAEAARRRQAEAKTAAADARAKATQTDPVDVPAGGGGAPAAANFGAEVRGAPPAAAASPPPPEAVAVTPDPTPAAPAAAEAAPPEPEPAEPEAAHPAAAQPEAAEPAAAESAAVEPAAAEPPPPPPAPSPPASSAERSVVTDVAASEPEGSGSRTASRNRPTGFKMQRARRQAGTETNSVLEKRSLSRRLSAAGPQSPEELRARWETHELRAALVGGSVKFEPFRSLEQACEAMDLFVPAAWSSIECQRVPDTKGRGIVKAQDAAFRLNADASLVDIIGGSDVEPIPIGDMRDAFMWSDMLKTPKLLAVMRQTPVAQLPPKDRERVVVLEFVNSSKCLKRTALLVKEDAETSALALRNCLRVLKNYASPI